MSALVLDAGALVAVERGSRDVLVQVFAARARGHDVRTNTVVVAQAWRGGGGRQARLAALLKWVDVREVTDDDGRAAGSLLGKSKTSDAVDATVALLARTGDRVLTSDPVDIKRLLKSAGVRATVVPC